MEAVTDSRGLDPFCPKDIVEFDNTKAGVKGLADLGLTRIPEFFIQPPQSAGGMSPDLDVEGLELPVIDVGDCDGPKREAVVEEIRKASETWGFFQVVNHSVPQDVMEGILQGSRLFHEQPAELKREYYSRDHSRKVRYYSNGNLLSCQVACWRDTVIVDFRDGVIDSEAIPQICRKEVRDYLGQIALVREKLSRLLSEALGLDYDYLESLGCMGSEFLLCHYYPSCPEPELTVGAENHSDPIFMTILLQDDRGGLQILHKGHWFDVSPLKGALVVNIGDMMQLITNNRFKSAKHRVLVTPNPRMSIACFCRPKAEDMSRPFGPIKELLQETDTLMYHSISMVDYQALYNQVRLVGGSALQHLKTKEACGTMSGLNH
ncbi:hypothetical protein MLD38_033086 [Melastoma candidum]|uniref:Uncharacterized protein n=1 Tax=Melastoma candidum TaxID=119954 RepID=A0ACB9M5P2_9MYRT|nr:hypothetical protein MLD38_033086 [Melastoma candidum]